MTTVQLLDHTLLMEPDQISPTSAQIPVAQPATENQPSIPNQPSQQNNVKPIQPVKFVGFGRLPALLIDLVIVLVICIPILYIMYYPGNIERTTSNIIFGLVDLVYSVFFVSIYGATPGKMLLKMKIVDKSYIKPRLWQILLRESLGKYASGLLLPISGLLVIFHKQKRSIHDFIAGTFVIYK